MDNYLQKELINNCESKQIISNYFLQDLYDDYVSKKNLANVVSEKLSIKRYEPANYKKFDENDYKNLKKEELEKLKIKHEKQKYYAYLRGFGGFNKEKNYLGVASIAKSNITKYYLDSLNLSNIYQLNEIQITKLNLMFIQTLYHELTHGYQSSIMLGDNKKDPIIREILLNDEYYFTHYPEIYDKCYDSFFTEYNAELESGIIVNNIIKENDYLNSKDIYTNFLENLVKNAYEEKSIMQKYFESTSQDISKFNFKHLSDEDKLLYGFPVKQQTLENYSKILKIK